jgi:hypothetical protein
MGKSCVGLETSAANFWMSLMAAVRGARPLDVTKHARLCLRETLDQIEEAEHDLTEEQARLVPRVKALRQAGASTGRVDAARLRPLLLQCRKVRAKMDTLAKKRLALENHIDTLDNSELNQHVLHSMQKTSHALKGMGLDKALESVDRVMMDLEENHGDVTSIQNSLASSFETGDDFDWEAEMALLLDSDAYGDDAAPMPAPTSTQLSGPATTNTIAVAMPTLAPLTTSQLTSTQLSSKATTPAPALVAVRELELVPVVSEALESEVVVLS